jgi:RND family efflux transporter MFP subunit
VSLRWSVVFLVTACGASEIPEVATEPVPVSLRDRVSWAAPTPGRDRVLVTLPGALVSRPGAVAQPAPREPGRLEAWLVQPGQVVTSGMALARLSSPQMSALARAVDRQRAVIADQQARVEGGFGTTAELHAAELDAVAASVALDAAHADFSRSGDGWLWRSPAAGTVSSLDCAIGAQVEPSSRCLTLIDPTSVEVEVEVPERHIAVLAGVTGRWHGADGRELSGLTLRSRAPSVHASSRTLELRLVADPPDASLVPGTSGRVDLIVPAVADAWELPVESLTRLDGEDVVFVRDGEAARHVPVKVLGPAVAAGHRVVTGALSATDEVAVQGVFLLKSIALLDGGEP